MRLVVDASVAIKWPIDVPDSELADRLLDGAHDFLAPELIIPEVLSAAWARSPRRSSTRSSLARRMT